MAERYIAFDIETPNGANDRICAIGLSIIENGVIIDDRYVLVNPETSFSPFNIELTGVTPLMVANAPSFPSVWEEICPIIDSGLLIAHNAQFDIRVLGKCLAYYQIPWQPYVHYICTYLVGRKLFPDMPNYKLKTLCSEFGIELTHHHAGSDSHACAELFLLYMGEGLQVNEEINTFELCTSPVTRGKRSIISENMQRLLNLKTILKNITSDGRLSRNEVNVLQDWLNSNAALRGHYPFDKIFDTVQIALEDGVIQEDELSSMYDLFCRITDPVANAYACNELEFEGRTFCLTGEFEYGDRNAIEAWLVSRGGIPMTSVTRKTVYLIVGSKGSDAWCAGNYGTKVKKALEMQSKGIQIEIIREKDLPLSLDALDNGGESALPTCDAAETIRSCLDNPRFVTAKENKNGTTSVSFFDKLGARIGGGQKGGYIELSSSNLSGDYQKYGVQYQERAADGYVRFFIELPDQIAMFSDALNKAWNACRRDSVDSFGCCSSFMECSDYGECVHMDDQFYYGCMYRENLNNNHIFYGKNQNGKV